ncbi:MAG: IPT/TIG domain-containing protein [Elusimicrobia bacterium]|nr:IPT/TIG domain-containing protein [Elusimicrobiota bacterium]
MSPSTGPIGISYTLTGSGFGVYNGANTQVLFGGATTAIAVWNDTTITGTVPALSTGAYAVVVERVQGGVADFSSAGTFTVTALTLAAPSPAAGPIGTAFTLSGTGFGAYNGTNTRLLVAGSTAAVSVWNDSTISGAVPGAVAPGAQPVWIERSYGGGLESSNTVYFTVTAPAIASVFPSSGPIGVAFTLTGSGFGVYNGANTQLLVGGTTAPVSVWNDTTITATLPGALSASTGPATLVVSRAGTGGVSVSTAASFLVLVPAPSTAAPASGPIGTAFSLSGSAFGPYNGANTQLLVGGTTAAVSVWNDQKITATVPALSSGSYPVVVRRLQGGYAQDGAPLTFTVTAPQVYAMTPSSAPIGAPFTITGAGFGAYNGANTTVKFNGVAAAVSVWNDATISGTVPGALSTGTAAVVVARAYGGGTASASAPDFAVLQPSVSTISPSYGLAGTAVTLSGSGFGPYAGASGTQLLVGGSTVAVAVWNDATIRWTVPSWLANGTYPVVVRRTPAGGSVASDPVAFTVGTAPGVLRLAPASATQRPDADFEGDLNLPAAEGGAILTPSQAAVTVPPGALAADTEITLARDRRTFAAARAEAMSGSALGAAGDAVRFGPEGTQFSTPVTIELPYDPAAVPAGALSGLKVHYFDPVAKSWTPLPSSVDQVRHVVSAQTTHFSLYQPLGQGIGVLAADAAFGLKAAYAFPNPVHSGAVTIRIQPGLADSVSVRVYDVAGRKVHESSDFALNPSLDDGNGLGAQYTYDHAWDVSGAGSGVYTYVITARKAGRSDIHKTGRIGVSK